MKKKDDSAQLVLEGTAEEEILAKLSQRVERAVALIQDLRRENDALRKKAADAELRLEEQEHDMSNVSQLETDLERYQGERDEVRHRIERILDSLEQLGE